MRQHANGAVDVVVDSGLAPLAKKDRPPPPPAEISKDTRPEQPTSSTNPNVASRNVTRVILRLRHSIGPGRFYVFNRKAFVPFKALKAGGWIWFEGGWLKLRPPALSLPPIPVLKRIPNGKPRVIRSTAEHPFYVFGRGWTPLNQIKPGEWIRTEDDWTEVGLIEDTGKWETVYNVRVKDAHTYFVGCKEWGFAVWAHNANCAEQTAALNGIEERLGNMSRNAELFLKNRPEAIHAEVMRIAETAIEVGRSTGRGNHVGQIFKDLLQPLHTKLDELGSRYNIEVEPGVLDGRRVLGKEYGHERLDAVITEMPEGAQRPALNPRMTFETQGMSMQQRRTALAGLEADLNDHTIIYGYDISIAHYPVNGHTNPLFTSATGWVKESIVHNYTTAFAPLARPGFQVFDVRVIGDQFLVNGTPRPVRRLVNGVLE